METPKQSADRFRSVVNAGWKSCDKREFIWSVAGITLGALVATNPFYRPHITLGVGVAAWFLSLTLVLLLSAHPITARVGVIVAGILFAVPCFLDEPPLLRGLLMCFMALPFTLAVFPLSLSPGASFRGRLVYFFTWLGTRKAKRCARSFDTSSLFRLIAATALLTASMACVKSVPAAGPWLLARWLAGGIMILAFAEMLAASHAFITALMGLKAAGLMRSPHLSTSISEFWSERWNPAASELVFRRYCFAPLARRSVALALFAAFLLSGIAHVLLPYMATGRWGISLMCGAFFLVQPPLIVAERWMKVRQWRRAAQRAWTLSALTVTSPLFVEPVLQIIEPSWGPTGFILLPTVAVLSFVIIVTAGFAIGFLLFGLESLQSENKLPTIAAAPES